MKHDRVWVIEMPCQGPILAHRRISLCLTNGPDARL
jgi:hypothetical protein